MPGDLVAIGIRARCFRCAVVTRFLALVGDAWTSSSRDPLRSSLRAAQCWPCEHQLWRSGLFDGLRRWCSSCCWSGTP